MIQFVLAKKNPKTESHNNMAGQDHHLVAIERGYSL
jgi:hypothetical protein